MLARCRQDGGGRVVVAALQARWWAVASKRAGSQLSVKLHLVVDLYESASASALARWVGGPVSDSRRLGTLLPEGWRVEMYVCTAK